MKPLQLTVYPPFEHDWQIDKRLTDAELAAEFWASHGEANAAMTGNRRLLFSRRATLARFATLPHYDEADQ